jgi:two-component system alkaline phosphatase synthesis response regulator PhoP
MRQLIFSVEDDHNIQNVIQIALSNSNFDIRMFENGNQLFETLETEVPNLFLLDLMLPDIDGLGILKKLKSNPKYYNIPVMIISAKVSEVDKVIGLDLGADDYLVKPFGVLELVSRVKALLRRTTPKEDISKTEINGLVINPKKYICSYKEREIIFTKKQFDLLYLLMSNHNEIVSRDDILNKVWGYEYVGETRTVDVHVKEIRRKLKEVGILEPTIETIRGIGYRFVL